VQVLQGSHCRSRDWNHAVADSLNDSFTGGRGVRGRRHRGVWMMQHVEQFTNRQVGPQASASLITVGQSNSCRSQLPRGFHSRLLELASKADDKRSRVHDGVVTWSVLDAAAQSRKLAALVRVRQLLALRRQGYNDAGSAIAANALPKQARKQALAVRHVQRTGPQRRRG